MGLYKRPRSPFWWFTFKVNGRRLQESTGVTDRRQAQEVYFKRRSDYASGKALERQTRLEVGKLLETYLKDYARVNKLSHESDEIAVRTLAGFFGDCQVADLTPQRIEQYKAHRRKTIRNGKPISGARVNRELAVLKAAFNKGMEWDLVVDNPVRRVKFFSEKDRGRTRYLNPEEKKRLLAACGPSLRPIVLLALKTGMRKGEILGLKWTDIDLLTNQLTLRRTKSGTIRHIPLHPDVRALLSEIPRHGEQVFAAENGTPPEVRGAIRSQFEAAVEEAGLRDFHFHDLRHTFASELVMKGADLKTVSELLGHSTTRMTERYSHLSPSHKLAAISLLSSELEPAAISLPVAAKTRK